MIKDTNINGIEIINKILNMKNKKQLYPQITNIKKNLILHSEIENILPNYKSDIEMDKYFLKEYFKILTNIKEPNISYSKFFEDIWSQDSMWVKDKINIIKEYSEDSLKGIFNNKVEMFRSEYNSLFKCAELKEKINSIIGGTYKLIGLHSEETMQEFKNKYGKEVKCNVGNILIIKDYIEDMDDMFIVEIDEDLKRKIKNTINPISRNPSENISLIEKINEIINSNTISEEQYRYIDQQ